MTHTLVLELPQEIYDPLFKTAQQTGATPEQLAVEWLKAASIHAARDPIEPFIGALPGPLPNWADRHDELFGQSVMNEASGNDNAGQ